MKKQIALFLLLLTAAQLSAQQICSCSDIAAKKCSVTFTASATPKDTLAISGNCTSNITVTVSGQPIAKTLHGHDTAFFGLSDHYSGIAAGQGIPIMISFGGKTYSVTPTLIAPATTSTTTTTAPPASTPQTAGATTDNYTYVPLNLPDPTVTSTQLPGKNVILYNIADTINKLLVSHKNPNNRHRDSSRIYVQAGKAATFIIQSLNPYKYKISVTKKDTAFNQFVPTIIASNINSSTQFQDVANIPIHCNNGAGPMKSMATQIKGYVDELQLADYVDMTKLKANHDTIVGRIYTRFNVPSDAILIDTFTCILDSAIAHKTDDTATLRQIITLYKQFVAINFIDYHYEIPQVPNNKDELIFTISVTPKDTAATGGIRINSESVHVPILGSFMINASTGFYWTPLFNHSYNLLNDSVHIVTPAGKDSLLKGKTVRQADRNNGNFGMTGLFHFYPKISTNFNVGGCIGVGVSLNETTTNVYYMAGLSLICGNSQRVIINLGAVLGAVDRLQSQYETNMLYDPSTTTVTTKVLEASCFFSLTYNIPFFNGSQNVGSGSSSSSSPNSSK